MAIKTGKVHVYTGDGKGKTTAAVGLAVRAASRGLKVRFIQFMKSDAPAGGEISAIEELTGYEVLRFCCSFFGKRAAPGKIDLEESRKGLAAARDILASGDCDLLVLDEINVAAHFGLVSVDEIVDLIEKKPAGTELVLTGRYAHPRVMVLADYVTEMMPVKHPFDKGAKARPGIEL